MSSLKIFTVVILSVMFGFGTWYLVIWFLTNESDPFKWSMFVKIIFLLMGGVSTESTIKNIENRN
jgi:hypothetical protein